MRHHRKIFCAFALVCVLLSGCSANGAVNTPSPLPIAKVAATPIQGKTSIVAVPANPVGNVQPVYISIANGTDSHRVPALPPEEAAHQAGGSAGLASSVETAAAYSAPAAAGGAATAAVG